MTRRDALGALLAALAVQAFLPEQAALAAGPPGVTGASANAEANFLAYASVLLSDSDLVTDITSPDDALRVFRARRSSHSPDLVDLVDQCLDARVGSRRTPMSGVSSGEWVRCVSESIPSRLSRDPAENQARRALQVAAGFLRPLDRPSDAPIGLSWGARA